MDAHRVEVLDRANDDAVIVAIAHDLHFVLFPTNHRFFEQDLARRRRIEAACNDLLELLAVIGNAAAGSTESEGRTDDGWEADFRLHGMRLFHAVRDSRA